MRPATPSQTPTPGRVPLLSAVVGVMLALNLGPLGAAGAATFTVNSFADLADSDPTDGKCIAAGTRACTLRAAVMQANVLSGGPHTIVLPAGTYTLTILGEGDNNASTGSLDITASMTITGSGGVARIQGDINTWSDRIFHIHSGSVTMTSLEIANGSRLGGSIRVESGATLALTKSTVRDAKEGGGIFNFGMLKLTSSTIRDNLGSQSGAGIANFGTLSLVRSFVSGNTTPGDAGGILNAGNADLVDSTIELNNASFGGGIHNLSGTLTLDRCTVDQNVAAGFGGGIYNEGSLTITNSTVSGNGALGAFAQGGGLFLHSGTATVNNVTITNNNAVSPGGGVLKESGAAFNFANTIIAGNTTTGGSGPDCAVNAAGSSLTSQGFNLIQNPTGCPIGGTTTGNITGQDPLLGVLQNNGGATATHALKPGSPAIDHGNPATPGTAGACTLQAQNGVNRPKDGNGDTVAVCDIGAFEVATVGGFDLAPSDATVEPDDPFLLIFTWVHTTNWHELDTLELRIVDEHVGPIFWIRWDQTSNTFRLFDEQSGEFGDGVSPGSHKRLENEFAELDLENTRVVTGGPLARDATLVLALRFKPKAAGHTFTDYRVQVLATDDLGNQQGFDHAGTLRVERPSH
jgi:CSLREA domain-containing protein